MEESLQLHAVLSAVGPTVVLTVYSLFLKAYVYENI